MVSFTLRPPYPQLDPALGLGGLERPYISSLPRLEPQFVPGPARNLISKPTELARFCYATFEKPGITGIFWAGTGTKCLHVAALGIQSGRYMRRPDLGRCSLCSTVVSCSLTCNEYNHRRQQYLFIKT